MTEKEKDIRTDSQDAQNGQQAQQEQVDTANAGADKLPEEDALDKKQRELDEMRDKYLRLVAEFDNFKKRNAKERIELMQTANKEVIISLLDVLDDSDRASKQLETSTDINIIKDGVTLVFNKLKSTLQAKGLKPMESLQTPFDADLHEAITEIPAPTEALKGKVLDELQKGYYLNDKLIRHAKVVVGK
ncbi:nucleotide exchange factor GrpE [Chitinophaga agrisoli]|uniref:Protein GrpE n=1 Tax=Chitinophaga agrisoli TaxID=2607653 RepID=A0A5B2VNW5_9BACT|nr:nucleotide exchange factor GrpE [Chitinophaga agrisoli]KAA2240484.1 nucleotide exchange factor GrpE [Chitinophaga agrisoli]